jgi:hypothetical protein
VGESLLDAVFSQLLPGFEFFGFWHPVFPVEVVVWEAGILR